MELLYIYIKDDGRNIKDCEFNFSPQYRFHYDKTTNNLSKEDLCDYIPNFWGSNIKNITAIIGKNGAGKTNLIEDILFLLSNPNENIQKIWRSCNGLILVYIDNNGKTLYRSNIEGITHSGEPLANFFKSFNDDFQVIYYSPNTDRRLLSCFEKLPKNIEDKSSGCLLRKIKGAYRPLSDNKAGTELFPPDSNELRSISDLDFWLFVNTLAQVYIISDYPEIEQHYPKGYSLPKELVITFRQPIVGKHSNETFASRLLNIFEVDDISKLPAFCSTLLEMEKSGNLIFPKGKNKYEYNPIGVLKRYIAGTEYPVKIGREHITKELISSLSSSFSWSDRVLPFIDAVQKGDSMPDIIANKFSLSWSGVSSGEFALFSLFSQLFTSIKFDKIYQGNQNRGYDNIILCLDEAEQSFHPEWQRQYVSFITKLMQSDIFNTVNFQIIIASHSPIVVSDFPKNNIIFLNKKENGDCQVIESIDQENTFGANIHTLYKNSFFLDGVPMGEFAKRKILSISDRVNMESCSTEIYNEIMLIGEPIIRNSLLDKYKEKQSQNEKIRIIDDEINRLNEKRQKLIENNDTNK